MLFESLIEILDPEPHRAALNMAIDEVLLESAQEPTLRIYRWAEPAVSFGYFAKFAEVSVAWPKRELVRRWTGGGVVPHGEDFTYTLVVPRNCPFFNRSPVESYQAIHAAIAGLVGGRARLAGLPLEGGSNACFESPVEHDVLVEERKIAGAAQRRTRAGLLHQGSVQLEGNILEGNILEGNILEGNILGGDILGGDILGGNILGSGLGMLGEVLSEKVNRRTLAEEELVSAAALAASKYGTDAWLRRY